MLNNKEFYKYAKSYALNKLTEAYNTTGAREQAEKHLALLIKPVASCDINKEETGLNDIYCRLLTSCQNRREMPEVIKFDKLREKFAELLFRFDASEVLKNYNASEDKVLQAFINIEDFKINEKKIPDSWKLFSKSVIDGAKFICRFASIDEFKQFISCLRTYFPEGMTVPEFISHEVRGLGKVLACDFLKEIGYVDYPKPDVHIKHIISEYFYNGKNVTNEEALTKVQEIAESAEVSAFEVDKILWLIASGKYYSIGDMKAIEIKNSSKNKLRDEFLGNLK